MEIITNNHPRFTVDACELTAAERAEFDYLDWDAIDAGTDSATFFRFRGELHDLGEFTRDYGLMRGSGLPDHLSDWHGYRSDSAFSAMLVRLSDDGETVVVGQVYS